MHSFTERRDKGRFPIALLDVHTPRQISHTTGKYHTWHTAYQEPFKECDVTLHFADDSCTAVTQADGTWPCSRFKLLSKLKMDVIHCSRTVCPARSIGLGRASHCSSSCVYTTGVHFSEDDRVEVIKPKMWKHKHLLQMTRTMTLIPHSASANSMLRLTTTLSGEGGGEVGGDGETTTTCKRQHCWPQREDKDWQYYFTSHAGISTHTHTHTHRSHISSLTQQTSRHSNCQHGTVDRAELVMSNCDCETSFQLYFETSIKAVTFHFHVVDFLHCPTGEHLPREIGVTFPEERLLRQSRATQRNLFHGSRALFPLPPSPASAVSSSPPPLPPSALPKSLQQMDPFHTGRPWELT